MWKNHEVTNINGSWTPKRRARWEHIFFPFLRCCKWHQPISLSWAAAWAQQWRCHWFQPKTAWCLHHFWVLPERSMCFEWFRSCSQNPPRLHESPVLYGKKSPGFPSFPFDFLSETFWSHCSLSGWEVLLWRTSSDCSFPEPQGCPRSAARQVKPGSSRGIRALGGFGIGFGMKKNGSWMKLPWFFAI